MSASPKAARYEGFRAIKSEDHLRGPTRKTQPRVGEEERRGSGRGAEEQGTGEASEDSASGSSGESDGEGAGGDSASESSSSTEEGSEGGSWPPKRATPADLLPVRALSSLEGEATEEWEEQLRRRLTSSGGNNKHSRIGTSWEAEELPVSPKKRSNSAKEKFGKQTAGSCIEGRPMERSQDETRGDARELFAHMKATSDLQALYRQALEEDLQRSQHHPSHQQQQQQRQVKHKPTRKNSIDTSRIGAGGDVDDDQDEGRGKVVGRARGGSNIEKPYKWKRKMSSSVGSIPPPSVTSAPSNRTSPPTESHKSPKASITPRAKLKVKSSSKDKKLKKHKGKSLSGDHSSSSGSSRKGSSKKEKKKKRAKTIEKRGSKTKKEKEKDKEQEKRLLSQSVRDSFRRITDIKRNGESPPASSPPPSPQVESRGSPSPPTGGSGTSNEGRGSRKRLSASLKLRRSLGSSPLEETRTLLGRLGVALSPRGGPSTTTTTTSITQEHSPRTIVGKANSLPQFIATQPTPPQQHSQQLQQPQQQPLQQPPLSTPLPPPLVPERKEVFFEKLNWEKGKITPKQNQKDDLSTLLTSPRRKASLPEGYSTRPSTTAVLLAHSAPPTTSTTSSSYTLETTTQATFVTGEEEQVDEVVVVEGYGEGYYDMESCYIGEEEEGEEGYHEEYEEEEEGEEGERRYDEYEYEEEEGAEEEEEEEGEGEYLLSEGEEEPDSLLRLADAVLMEGSIDQLCKEYLTVVPPDTRER